MRDKYVKFSLWIYELENWEQLREIGQHFKDLTKLPPKFQVVYQLHKSAINKQLDNNYFSAI